MENTTSGEISGSFNEATHEEIIQNVYTRTPYSESHPNDLAGSIHPMFARGNWYIHPTIYSHNSDHHQFFKVMDPVFRLASNLLQSPNSRLFLAAFFFAARHPLVELSNRLGREARQFNRIEGKDYSKVVSRTTTLLNRLAGQIGFEWYDPVDEIAIVPRNAYGYCTRKLRTHAYMSKSGRPTGYVSRISLSLELFVKLRDLRLSLQESSSANVEGILSQILRLQFVMASALCHEVVHACNYSITLRTDILEPFFEDERISELGHSWESAVIGGMISPRVNGEGSNHGESLAANALLIMKWPPFEYRGTGTSLERSPPLLYQNNFYIPMDWIARIQQEDEWQSTNPDDITALLVIPRSLGFTDKYPGDDFDPDWRSKFDDELNYLNPELVESELKEVFTG